MQCSLAPESVLLVGCRKFLKLFCSHFGHEGLRFLEAILSLVRRLSSGAARSLDLESGRHSEYFLSLQLEPTSTSIRVQVGI